MRIAPLEKMALSYYVRCVTILCVLFVTLHVLHGPLFLGVSVHTVGLSLKHFTFESREKKYTLQRCVVLDTAGLNSPLSCKWDTRCVLFRLSLNPGTSSFAVILQFNIIIYFCALQSRTISRSMKFLQEKSTNFYTRLRYLILDMSHVWLRLMCVHTMHFQ